MLWQMQSARFSVRCFSLMLLDVFYRASSMSLVIKKNRVPHHATPHHPSIHPDSPFLCSSSSTSCRKQRHVQKGLTLVYDVVASHGVSRTLEIKFCCWIEKGKDTGHRDVGRASAELHLGFQKKKKSRLCLSTPAILPESQHPSPCTVGARKSVGLCEQIGHCHCVCAGVLVRTRVDECGGTRDLVAISVSLTHTISDSGIVAVSLPLWLSMSISISMSMFETCSRSVSISVSGSVYVHVFYVFSGLRFYRCAYQCL